jgi:hypothetical protein
MMEQLVEFKSNFSYSKLVLIWFVLLCVLILPWVFLLFQFDKVLAVFVILTNMVVFAIIIYVKIVLKIIIDKQERVVECYSMRLLGKKRQISINLKNAYINLNTIRSRSGKLWNLVIIDNEDSTKRIMLTETEGYDDQEIRQIYGVLKRVTVD